MNILSYFLQLLSFTSIQLDKSDVDMEGTVTEKVNISLISVPMYDTVYSKMHILSLNRIIFKNIFIHVFDIIFRTHAWLILQIWEL